MAQSAGRRSPARRQTGDLGRNGVAGRLKPSTEPGDFTAAIGRRFLPIGEWRSALTAWAGWAGIGRGSDAAGNQKRHRMGRDAGDAVVRAMARRLQRRKCGFGQRWSGCAEGWGIPIRARSGLVGMKRTAESPTVPVR
jgi:hypothetical protein